MMLRSIFLKPKFAKKEISQQLPAWTRSRMDTIAKGLNRKWTQSQMDANPIVHDLKWSHSRMDVIPNGRFQLYTVP